MLIKLLESLKIDFGLCKSKLYELTIYHGQSMQQLNLPALSTRSSGLATDPQKIISPQYIRALLSFIEGCQTILQVFLHVELGIIRALPMLTMFRAVFAFKALAMLKRRMETCDDIINLLVDEQTVGFDSYSHGVLKAVEAASDGGLYAYPHMLVRVRQAMLKSKVSESSRKEIQTTELVSRTVEQPSIADLAANDFAYMNQGELHNSLPLSMPFYESQHDSGGWPTYFVDPDIWPI